MRNINLDGLIGKKVYIKSSSGCTYGPSYKCVGYEVIQDINEPILFLHNSFTKDIFEIALSRIALGKHRGSRNGD